MGIWEKGVLKEWVLSQPDVVPDKKNVAKEGKKYFKGPKVGDDHFIAPKGYFLELPGKLNPKKISAGNSPIRKEPNTLNPPEKMAKKPAVKSPNEKDQIQPK